MAVVVLPDPLAHPYYAGMEHVGLPTPRHTLFAPTAKRREVFSESHEG